MDNRNNQGKQDAEVGAMGGAAAVQTPGMNAVARDIMNQDKPRNSRNSNTRGQGPTITENEIVLENGQTVSFRGKAIPVVERRQPYTIANSDEIIAKAKAMSDEELESFTIVGIHLMNRQISEVKLSTGEVIDIETAIALSENDYLKGFSTGATMKGGKTLRTKPSPDNSGKNGIYDLPRF